MRIAVTGSSGLIGTALCADLEGDGHDVVRVVRGGSGAGEGSTVRWDIEAGTIDTAGLEGLDGVIHLAGAGIADSRWSEQHKRAVKESRSKGTDLLARTLAGLDAPPPVLLSGSAIGFYGDRGEEVLTETSAPGEGFLPEVCTAWEAATAPAQEAGIRVVHLRTGVVLSPDGGALGKQLLPFKLGLGGKAGKGDQWLPWITLDDHVRAMRFLLESDVHGPADLTAPNPVTNVEFVRTLGAVLGRPTILPIPGFVRKIPAGVGPLVDNLLFASLRVLPAVLTDAGFTWRHETLEPALRDLLNRR
jgi:uncharacterized protein (TIGR01777 family)